MGQPIVVSVGSLVAASATKISLSQKAAAAQYLVLNGAAGSFTANNICLSQTPSGAGALTLNGTLCNTNQPAGAGGSAAAGSAAAQINPASRIYITSAGNDSGRTFTIVGTLQTPNTFGMGIGVTETITGANASVVSSANQYSTITSITISGAAAGAVTVGTYASATLDTGRRVIITSGGDDSGITFALSGTDWSGVPISETITGASAGVASSVLDYLTVTSIRTSGAVATTVTVGTNTVAGSPWVRFDDFAAAAQVAIQATVSGTVNFTVQQTMDDPNYVTNQLPTPTYRYARSAVTWVNHPDSALAAATATAQGNYAYPPVFARVVLNSGSGTVTGTFRQVYTGG